MNVELSPERFSVLIALWLKIKIFTAVFESVFTGSIFADFHCATHFSTEQATPCSETLAYKPSMLAANDKVIFKDLKDFFFSLQRCFEAVNANQSRNRNQTLDLYLK